MNAKKTYYILFYAAIIVLTSFFMSSCEKKKNLETFVEGRVLTYGTNDAATSQSLLVKLMHEEAVNAFAGKEILVDETTTDENGYFSFSFTAHNDYTRYFIRLMEGAARHSGPSVANQRYIETGERQVQNFYLSPHAWLKLHIENANPQPGDRITISWGGGDLRTFHGTVNEVALFFGGGNIARSIPFELYRDNEWIRWRDTVWMQAWDTTYLKIEY